jgi:hypothetical protein
VRGEIFKSKGILRIKLKMADLLERKICIARQELPNLEITVAERGIMGCGVGGNVGKFRH